MIFKIFVAIVVLTLYTERVMQNGYGRFWWPVLAWENYINLEVRFIGLVLCYAEYRWGDECD